MKKLLIIPFLFLSSFCLAAFKTNYLEVTSSISAGGDVHIGTHTAVSDNINLVFGNPNNAPGTISYNADALQFSFDQDIAMGEHNLTVDNFAAVDNATILGTLQVDGTMIGYGGNLGGVAHVTDPPASAPQSGSTDMNVYLMQDFINTYGLGKICWEEGGFVCDASGSSGMYINSNITDNFPIYIMASQVNITGGGLTVSGGASSFDGGLITTDDAGNLTAASINASFAGQAAGSPIISTSAYFGSAVFSGSTQYPIYNGHPVWHSVSAGYLYYQNYPPGQPQWTMGQAPVGGADFFIGTTSGTISGNYVCPTCDPAGTYIPPVGWNMGGDGSAYFANQQVNISSAGQVGIGTLFPTQKLQISSGTLLIDGNTAASIIAKGSVSAGSFTAPTSSITTMIGVTEIDGGTAGFQNVLLKARDNNFGTGLATYLQYGPSGSFGVQRLIIPSGITFLFSDSFANAGFAPITGGSVGGLRMYATSNITSTLPIEFLIDGSPNSNPAQLHLETFSSQTASVEDARFRFNATNASSAAAITVDQSFHALGGETVESTFTLTKLSPGVLHVVAGSSQVVTGLILSTEITSGIFSVSVGTGTATNYTNVVTTNTQSLSFLGGQFKSVKNGTTNFISVDPSSVTLKGQNFNYLASLSAADQSISVTGGSGSAATPTIGVATSNSAWENRSFGANPSTWTFNTHGGNTPTLGWDTRGFIIGSGSLDVLSTFTAYGHILTSTNTAFPVPSVSSCGTGFSLSAGATDTSGLITVGSGVVTSCTLTFGTAFANTPACVVNSNVAITAQTVSPSRPNVIIGAGATFSGDVLNYICLGNK